MIQTNNMVNDNFFFKQIISFMEIRTWQQKIKYYENCENEYVNEDVVSGERDEKLQVEDKMSFSDAVKNKSA